MQKNPKPSAFNEERSPASVGVYESGYVIELITIDPVPQDMFAVVTFHEYLVVALMEYTFSCMSGML